VIYFDNILGITCSDQRLLQNVACHSAVFVV